MPDLIDINPQVFCDYDIRGIVNETLTPEVIFAIGKAFASEVIKAGFDTLVLGFDGRISSVDIAQTITEGIKVTGVNIINIGLVPTGILYYANFALKIPAGIMITGSHNPTHYNGFKFVLNYQALFGDKIIKLQKRIENNHYLSLKSRSVINHKTITDGYIDKIIKQIKLSQKIKVVIDCGNGATGHIAPKLFSAIGAEVTSLYDKVDGNFPNHHPDPAVEDNLTDLKNAVLKENADVGLAFDGDGDRLGVVSNTGKTIWPDDVLALFVQFILKKNKKSTVVYDVKCSKFLEEVITRAGGTPLMYKTGHSNIKAKMKETGALLGGEMSGHLFFADKWYGVDDALYAGVRLLALLTGQDKSLDELTFNKSALYNTPEILFPIEEEKKIGFIEAFKNKLDTKNVKVIDIDGLRIETDEGWGLIRQSNTTPNLTMRFEANNKKHLKELKNKFINLAESINN